MKWNNNHVIVIKLIKLDVQWNQLFPWSKALYQLKLFTEDIERFRALSRELYLSESELDYLIRTNEFKNRLSDAQNAQLLGEASSGLEFDKRLDEINKDRLLHEEEIEKFKSLLKNERTNQVQILREKREGALPICTEYRPLVPANLRLSAMLPNAKPEHIRQDTA